MEEKKQNIGIRYGLITACCLIAFTALLYWKGVDAFLSKAAYLGYAITISFATLAALLLRKRQGGELRFSEALKTCFTVFVIALAGQTLFTWLLVNYLDPAFKPVLNEATLLKMEAYWKSAGMPDDLREKSMAAQRSGDAYTLGQMTIGWAISCIVHFIISLLIALFVKKKK